MFVLLRGLFQVPSQQTTSLLATILHLPGQARQRAWVPDPDRTTGGGVPALAGHPQLEQLQGAPAVRKLTPPAGSPGRQPVQVTARGDQHRGPLGSASRSQKGTTLVSRRRRRGGGPG